MNVNSQRQSIYQVKIREKPKTSTFGLGGHDFNKLLGLRVIFLSQRNIFEFIDPHALGKS